jgi:hypothetical protein
MSEREDVLRAWRAGEERLYSVAATRPDLYGTCLELVRAFVAHLERVPDVDALVATYRTSSAEQDLAEAGVEAAGVSPEIRLELVRDAAYQLRERELAQRSALERTQHAIRRARSAGDPVAEVWSEGENEMWPPYRRVQMSLRTGNAVAVSTHLTPALTPVFALEGVVLDPETGEATGESPLAPQREFTDPEEWRAAAERLRSDLLS